MRQGIVMGGGGALTSTSFRSIGKRIGVGLAALAVAGATVLAQPAQVAQAAEGQISELSLAVANDGTEPFDAEAGPGKDTGATNGVVRTHDTITYNWTYRNDTTGAVTFTQTLPEGATWVPASASLCDNEDAIADNGRTLNCKFNNLEAGSGSLQVTAKINAMANGANLRQRVSVGGINSNPVTTNISATPMFLLGKPWASSPIAVSNTGYRYFTRVDIGTSLKSSANPEARGLEALKSPVIIKYDLSELPDGVSARGCDANRHTGFDLVTTANKGTCTFTVDDNKIGTLTITGADFSGTYLPTRYTDLGQYTADSQGLMTYYVHYLIPKETLPESEETPKVKIIEFDPEGLSGQSNYGDGYASGTNPAGPHSLVTSIKVPGKDYVGYYLSPVEHRGPLNAETGRAIPTFIQDSTVVPNEVVGLTKYVGNWSLNSMDAPEVCSLWRTDQFSLVNSDGNNYQIQGGDNEVEFYSTPVTDDATLSTFDCGHTGDGAEGWHASIEEAGGIDKISAIRAKRLADLNTSDGFAIRINLKRKKNIPAGTLLSAVSKMYLEGKWRPENSIDIPTTSVHDQIYNGLAQWVASDGIIGGEWTRKPSVMEPGKPAAFTFVPKASNPYSDSVATLLNTNVTVKLPGCMNVTGAPTNDGKVTGDGGKADCAAEGQTITWPLGTLRSTDSVRELSFTADTAFDAKVPADTNFVAVVESESDNSAEANRTFKAPVPVQGVQSFGASQVVSPSTVVEPGQDITSHVRWVNASSEAFNGVKVVQVMPHNGDVSGSTVNAKLVGLPKASDGVVVQVTTDPVASVKNALRLNKTGDSGINWVASVDDASAVTAVRYNVGYLPVGSKGESTMVLRPVAYSNGTKVVPVISALTGSSQAGPIELENFTPRDVRVVSAKSVSGRVGVVDSPAGSATPGGSGASVKLSGYSFGPDGVDNGGQGDDVAVTKTVPVGSDGSYSFGDVLAGKYSVGLVSDGFVPVGDAVAVDVAVEPAAVSVDEVLKVKAKTGSIAGRVVKDPKSVAASAGVPAGTKVKVTGYAFGPDGVDNGGKGDDVAVTKTVAMKPDGSYDVSDLPPGKYSVGFADLPAGAKAGKVAEGLVVTPGKRVSAGEVSVVMPEVKKTVAGSVAVVDSPAGSATPAGKGAKAKLSGYTFGPDGVDNGGKGDDVAFTKTVPVSSDGSYSFGDVPAGKYKVGLEGDDFAAVGDGVSVVVPVDPNVKSVSVDEPLKVKAKTGSITGSVVKDPASHPSAGGVPAGTKVKVDGYAFGPDGVDNGGKGDDVAVTKTVSVNPDGSYDVSDLPPGKYDVGFADLPDGAKAGKLAEGVVVAPGKSVSAGEVSIVLPQEGATVSGGVELVDSPAGSASPAGKAKVKISGHTFGPDGVDNGGKGDDEPFEMTVTVEPDGSFSFEGVPAGEYMVDVDGDDPAFESSGDGVRVVVPVDADSVGVDQSLGVKAKTGSLQGKAPLPVPVASGESPEVPDGVKIRVDGYAFGPDGVDDGGKGDDVAVAVTVETKDGSYDVSDLPPGKYDVGLADVPKGEDGSPFVEGVVVKPGGVVDAGAAGVVPGLRYEIVMATAEPVGVSSFRDVRAGMLFTGEIEWMKVTGVSTGWRDGTYRPLTRINRDAMAAFMYRLAGSPDVVVDKAPFSDIPVGYQFAKEIVWMKDSGITTGYRDGSFRPHGSVNRDAMAAFMFRFCSKYADRCAVAVNPASVPVPVSTGFGDVPVGYQFESEIKWLVGAKITTGYRDGSYRPLSPIRRDAMAAFVYRMKNNYLRAVVVED